MKPYPRTHDNTVDNYTHLYSTDRRSVAKVPKEYNNNKYQINNMNYVYTYPYKTIRFSVKTTEIKGES